MKKRTLVALPLVVLMFVVVFVNSEIIKFVILLFAVTAQIEMYNALKKAGYTPTLWTGLIFLCLIYPVDYFFGIQGAFLLFAVSTGLNRCWAIFFSERQFLDIILS